MMNGNFQVSLSTPMGSHNGTLSLFDQNGALSGSLRAMGNDNPFQNGKAIGNNFEFSGSIKTGFGRIEYAAKGTVVGDTLKATADTKFGVMKINGTRM